MGSCEVGASPASEAQLTQKPWELQCGGGKRVGREGRLGTVMEMAEAACSSLERDFLPVSKPKAAQAVWTGG